LLSGGQRQQDFTLHAELNWNVLGVTAALSVVCGLLFGLAPAIQSTRPDVMPALKNCRGGGPRRRSHDGLMVLHIARPVFLLLSAQLGYALEMIFQFPLTARPAVLRDQEIITFYAHLRKRFESIPGVSSATLSRSSIISAGFAGSPIRGEMKIGAITIDDAGV